MRSIFFEWPRRSDATRPSLFFIVCLPMLLIATAFFSACSKKETGTPGRRGAGGPVPVKAAEVTGKTVPVDLTTFGTAEARSSIAVKAEVTGSLMKVHFEKGQRVKKGDLLFTIDSRAFKAALQQAEATLERNRAIAKNAEVELKRISVLVGKGIGSDSERDKILADAQATAALVRADEAAVERARLLVERCSIRSPVDGRTGNLLVNEGSLVKAEDVTLVTINQISPIDVFFAIPQRDLQAVKDHMAREKLQVAASFPAEKSPAAVGELTFVDNAVDRGTGTVRLGATFDNKKEILWPGQYVLVTLTLAMQRNAVAVPSSAVQVGRDRKSGAAIRYVFVIRQDNSVEFRPVTVSRTQGSECIIENGLQVGDRVVTDGQHLLVDKTRVNVQAPSTGETKAAAEGAGS